MTPLSLVPRTVLFPAKHLKAVMMMNLDACDKEV